MDIKSSFPPKTPVRLESYSMWGSGPWGFVKLCSSWSSIPRKEYFGQLTPKSVIFFKNLVRKYRVKCAKFDTGASAARLEVKLFSIWQLPPVRSWGGVFTFWQWARKRLPNYPCDSDQICYATWGWSVIMRFCSSSGSAPSKGFQAIYPWIRQFLQTFMVKN